MLQILRTLTRERYGWKSHPAVRMWAGHEEALAGYGLVICRTLDADYLWPLRSTPPA